MKSYDELSKEQAAREGRLLSDFSQAELEKMSGFEAELGQRRDEILFKIATEIEDSKNALEQVEQLARRLKRHLEKLTQIQQILSK